MTRVIINLTIYDDHQEVTLIDTKHSLISAREFPLETTEDVIRKECLEMIVKRDAKVKTLLESN